MEVALLAPSSEGLDILYFDLLTLQGYVPEGSVTFQLQLGEEIAWAEIGQQNGTS